MRGGEIVGIAGVSGNGQDELFAALSGERLSPGEGAVVIDGEAAGLLGVTERRRMGAAFVPEERLGHGTAPRMKLSENALLTGHAASGMVKRGFVNKPATLAVVDRTTKTFDVRKAKRDPEAVSLSGGNLQKFIVGREILREPGVLIVSQPTWGVDAGAAAVIRQALIDLASRGAAVLVISQDLDELAEIADRIAVMFHGRLSAPLESGRGNPRKARIADGRRATPNSRSPNKRPSMPLVLEKRAERSAVIAVASPLIAIALSLVTIAIVFAILGKNPFEALGVYFVEPLTDSFSLQEIAVKATPLVMIAVGLVALLHRQHLEHWRRRPVHRRRRVRQLARGANQRHRCRVFGCSRPCCILGALGGALYALIPAICRVYFGASEILTSLMLVYVADFGMDYLVRGPWRDPQGLNFPTTATFDPVATRADAVRAAGRAACRLGYRARRRDAGDGAARTHHHGI